MACTRAAERTASRVAPPYEGWESTSSADVSPTDGDDERDRLASPALGHSKTLHHRMATDWEQQDVGGVPTCRDEPLVTDTTFEQVELDPRRPGRDVRWKARP